tara:strand:- start:59 stop:643 length:585 start_codon:yes stop_codon:yes gene_type:complete
MTEFEEKYDELNFPKNEIGKKILGIDLQNLFSDSKSLIKKYLDYKAKLTISDFELLQLKNSELKSVTQELNGISKTEFATLWNLSNQIVSDLNSSKRFLKNSTDEKIHKEWKKKFIKIREILNEWDPLGVSDFVDDEYDAINFLAYSAAINSGEIISIKSAIKKYLTESMEISESDKKLETISLKIKNVVQHRI